jgi:thiamine biosynthesis lipoprotein
VYKGTDNKNKMKYLFFCIRIYLMRNINKKNIPLRFLNIILFCLILMISCRRGSRGPIERVRFLMDTLVRISIYDQHIPLEKIETDIEYAFGIISNLEKQMSFYVNTNELGIIAGTKGKSNIQLSQQFLWLLKKSVDISENTNGAFDVTTGILKNVWDFYSDNPNVPVEKTINDLIDKVDYRNIHFINGGIRLDNPDMMLDLGGIAKGYIIDQIIEILKERGLKSGIIDAGGDLKIFGNHPFRKSWRIGIRHPRKEGNDLIGVLEVDVNSVATSGDYERYFIQDGKRYHHILDPKTGYPAQECVSVTIVTKNALEADGYATAVFVLGPEKGMELIEQHPDIEGLIFYEESGELRHSISRGLLKKLHLY